jgi:hypothetical protein
MQEECRSDAPFRATTDDRRVEVAGLTEVDERAALIVEGEARGGLLVCAVGRNPGASSRSLFSSTLALCMG